MPFLAPAIPYIIAGASAYMSYMGARQQAKSEKALYEYNAQVKQAESDHVRLASQEAQRAQRDKMRKVLATQRSRYGAANVIMTGSPLEMQLETIETFEADIAASVFEKNMDIDRLKSSATMDRYRAQASKTAGKYAMASAILGGASSMMGIYSKSQNQSRLEDLLGGEA